MNTIYSQGGDTKEVQQQTIAAIRAGAQARYLKRAGRFGWDTKLIEVTSDNRLIRVLFKNGVGQDYSVTTFCNTFGLHPIPVKNRYQIDEVGEYICIAKGQVIGNVHKTQRIAELAATKHTEREKCRVAIVKVVSQSHPICKAEIHRK